MPKRKKPEETPEEQFKRFVKTAKEHQVDESGKEFERAFKKVTRPRPLPGKSFRKTLHKRSYGAEYLFGLFRIIMANNVHGRIAPCDFYHLQVSSEIPEKWLIPLPLNAFCPVFGGYACFHLSKIGFPGWRIWNAKSCSQRFKTNLHHAH